MRPVEIQVSHSGDSKRAGVLCDLRDDITWINVSSHRLERWSSTPQRLIAFFAAELNLPIPGDISVPGLVRLGRLTNHKRRPLISISFDETISIQIGNHSVEPSELIEYDGQRFHLNMEKLNTIADLSAHVSTNDKPYTPSQIRQQYKKLQRENRDRDLQTMCDRIKQRYPGRSKEDIARDIKASGLYPEMSVKRIERIIRVEKN